MLHEQSFLIFELNNRLCAFDIKHVLEVVMQGNVTQVPLAESYIAGIISFRGDMVTVIDAELKLGFDVNQNHSREQIIVINKVNEENQQQIIGCMVDKVLKVVSIPISGVQAPIEFGSYYTNRHSNGFFYYNTHAVTIFDIDKLFQQT